ncbi:melanoma inhibitory activity protein 2 isoform X2 [Dendrobates tinctorius]|uniref:melanoma inhibitory activity protein 2 isoform X2 n=1 Tax=Dendrobates tinctorius TaxID=92724 RepID=UPI003CC9990A
MADMRVSRVLVTLVLLSYTTQVLMQKILSEWKKCGDPNCESLMMRVSANQDYSGPDCRFLTFKTGDEINVYYKLTGKREDLWQGSTGKAYGFFPKDSVTIEEVYLGEEIEIPAQEIDFVCLDGGEYVFENEDSVLHHIKRNKDDPIDQTIQEDGQSTQDVIIPESPEPEVQESWTPSGIAGWFGMGKKNEMKDAEAKIINMEIINEEAEEAQKQQEEDTPEKSGWLGGRLKKFLPFGEKKDEPKVKDDENYGGDSSTSNEQTDQDQINTKKEAEDSKSKWFHFGIRDVLGFGAKTDKKEESNLNVVGTDDEISPENHSQDSNPMLALSETSRMDQSEKTKDVQMEYMAVTNAPDKDGNNQDEFSHLKEMHQSYVHLDEALTEIISTFLEEKVEEEKERGLEEEHFTTALGSNQADDTGEYVAKNKEDSDTLSQEIKFIEVDSFVIDQEEHQPKVYPDNEMTKKVNTFHDGEEHDEKPELEDPEPVQTSESRQEDDSRDHRVMSNEYSDSLSQRIDDGLKHGAGSVIIDDHDKAEVTNFEVMDQPQISLVDKWTLDREGEYEEFPKRLKENFNPMETQEQYEIQIPAEVVPIMSDKWSLDDHFFVSSHDLRDEVQSTDEDKVSTSLKTGRKEVEETNEEHKTIGSENRKQAVSTTSQDQDCMRGHTEDAQSFQDGHQGLTAGSIYISADKTTEENLKSVTEMVTESQLDLAEKGKKLRSQEDTEDVENESDTPKSREEKVSSHCDAAGTPGTGEGCAVTKSPGNPWKRPQGTEESPDASYASLLTFTEMMRKISSGSREVHSRYLVPVRSQITRTIREVASLLPDDLQPGVDFFGCPWDVVIFTAIFGFVSLLAFTCRTLQCIKSRFYAGREYRLGNQVAEALSGKREVLEKLCVVQKQYEEVQRTLQESGHQKLLSEISEHKALQESLQASNKELEENMAKLERGLEEEKQRGSELDSALEDLNEKIKSLEENFKKETSQKEETRTTQKVFEINTGRLESSLQDAAEEKSHLEESIKQLSKEAEGWEERFSELSENSRNLSSSVGVMQEDLSSKQSQVKSLIENLLSLKDWSSEVDEVNDEEDDNILSSIKWDFENGEPLGDPQKQRIKKLIYAAMLNASLKSVESEKKHLCDNLSDEMKAKEQLAECITNLQNSSQLLSHEKGQLEEELEKLKQKMSVMMEVYQENEQKLHRKLTVQEKERVQKEAKLSKADEKMNMATSELVNVKTRVSELEEEMDKTVSSYQNQVTSYEKKSHDNWLTARAAERFLSDVKKETAHFRQKLTEAEYKLELLEKDPFALDVMQAIGRAYADAYINHPENSPFGLSPISRHHEGRAFLSPPTLLDGPLRLSPMPPTADRGVRPPGYYPGYPGPKERGDVNSDRRADHQRSLSDAGSLSPPWDREQRNNVPPPGLPYPEPPFPPRRAERFYHYPPPPSGRFSGPAELTRSQAKPFVDPQDGRTSPEYKARINASRNGEEEANNVSAASSQDNDVMDGQAREIPMHLPPPMRVPLLPRDPRAPYFRRPFMPPPPMDMYGPPGYPGMPPPHIPMRSPVPLPQPHLYPAYPIHGEAYLPPVSVRPPAGNYPTPDSAPAAANSLPPPDKLPEPTT